MPSQSDVIDVCESDELSLLRLLWVDNGGIVRGRVVDANNSEKVLNRGVSWPKGVQRLTAIEQSARDVPISSSGESMLMPDPETFRKLPYAKDTAAMVCDAYSLEGEPWEIDPRSRLQSYLDKLQDEDLTVSSVFESEFYLIKETEDGFEPFDDHPDHSADGMQSSHEIVLDIVEYLKDQGMEFSVYYPELGPGQQEVVIKHEEGLRAADNKVFHEQTVKAVANSYDIDATFIPKPFKDVAGSGCHIHISIWDENNNNIFYDDNIDSLYPISQTGLEFIGGLLDHAPALLAITTPNVVSYRRIRANSFASAHTCWGEGNRESMIRIPAAFLENPESSTRVEFKPADNTANPYLSLLAILAAGMDGIERSLDPGPPVNKSPTKLSDKEKSDKDIHRLPTSLGEALTALEKDEIIKDAFGDKLYDSYINLKRKQWDEFSGQGEITDWEIDNFIRSF